MEAVHSGGNRLIGLAVEKHLLRARRNRDVRLAPLPPLEISSGGSWREEAPERTESTIPHCAVRPNLFVNEGSKLSLAGDL